MRVLIQHTETALYLGKGNQWSHNPQDALAFVDEVRARDYCIYRRFTDVKVVVLPDHCSPECAAGPGPEAPSTADHNDIEMENTKPNAVQNIRDPRTIVVVDGNGRARLTTAETTSPVPGAPEAASKRRTPKKAASTKASPATPRPTEAPVTTVEAKIDVGFGNALFIRGQGDGLSWDKGTPLQCVDPQTWAWSTTQAKEQLVFKLLLNDLVWSQGENLTVEPGKRTEVVPVFP